jgi:hypothetical protein
MNLCTFNFFSDFAPFSRVMSPEIVTNTLVGAHPVSYRHILVGLALPPIFRVMAPEIVKIGHFHLVTPLAKTVFYIN